MTKSKLQINFEYLLARSLLAIFRLLPLRMGLFVGSTLAGWTYPLAGRLRRAGERNLQLAFPEMGPRARAHLLRGCFRNLGRLLAVFSHFTAANPRSLQRLIEREGLERIEEARASGKGVILFTGHIGAWELSSFALSLCGYPLSFLVRRIDNPAIEAQIDRARTR